MAKKTSVGIDIGTYKIKVMVCQAEKSDRVLPRVVGTGSAESKGLRHGYIVNPSEVSKSIMQAVEQAEKVSGVKIRRAFISVGGIGLGTFHATGAATVSRADSEVTNLDVRNALENAEKEIPPSEILNRRTIHTIPTQYKIDGKAVLGRVVGMKGTRLEVKALFISCLEQHLNDLIGVVEEAGVDVIDVAASPLAASFVTLSKTQKMAGCVLANIGSETTSIVVFENNLPISLEVFPIGSTDITNDIALGFKIPLEDAERVKTGALGGSEFSRRKIDDIIAARLGDIFELIESHLKKIGRNGLLPAGIIITGGGSGVSPIEDAAKSALRLPARIASFSFGEGGGGGGRLRDSSWSVAYGLCLFGLSSDSESVLKHHHQNLLKTLLSFARQLLP
ncbi:MAG: cell division protein FtsA [Candidatus Taylorbacteria bacterium]|nr:cell division protein FtsA [Candidatus Taylorbacteria bacterium]